jgi:hypothetical protein
MTEWKWHFAASTLKIKQLIFQAQEWGLCYIGANGEMREVKADFFSLGGFHFKPNFKYSTQTIFVSGR